MELDPFIADGIITGEMRRRLRDKRISLGLTYTRVGSFFGVNWSTVRKWEKGLTTVCNYRHRRGLLEFIRGEYDQRLRLTPPGLDRRPEGLRHPMDIQLCMERLSTTYLVCKDDERMRQDFVQDIERITSDILRKLVDAINRSAPPGPPG